MDTAICTVSSASHLFKVKALQQSLEGANFTPVYCLVSDSDSIVRNDHSVNFLSCHEVPGVIELIQNRGYRGDQLRWACKPLLLLHLLKRYQKVIYVDNDVFFFSSPLPLFSMLEEYAVLLTPHHYPADPLYNQNWLEANFRVGLYNAGFVGASQQGIDALKWWADCCRYNVRKSSWRGLFDDQKYLDLLPVKFQGVQVLRHRGCNVAGWNVQDSRRTLGPDGSILINDVWPLVFVHFNRFTIRAILNGTDPLLSPLLKVYEEVLRSFNPQYLASSETSRTMGDLKDYLRHIAWRFARIFD